MDESRQMDVFWWTKSVDSSSRTTKKQTQVNMPDYWLEPRFKGLVSPYILWGSKVVHKWLSHVVLMHYVCNRDHFKEKYRTLHTMTAIQHSISF